MIALIIKGSPADARSAMLARLIPWNDSFVSAGRDNIETLGRCSSEALLKVQAWMAEPPFQGDFPVGTLLFYQELESDAADRASLEASAKHQPQSQEELLP